MRLPAVASSCAAAATEALATEATTQLPTCTTPEDMLRGSWFVNNTGLIEPRTGTLSVAASNFLSVWDVAKQFHWQPLTCNFNVFANEAEVARVLDRRHVVFVGDSTLVEQFMIVTELVRHNSWTLANNAPSLRTELVKAGIAKMRLFDSGFRLGRFTLRFLWNGAPNVVDNAWGLRVFDDADWLARFQAFVRAPVSLQKQPTIMFIGSGLHDVSSKNIYFNFDAFRVQVRSALAKAMATGAKVFWVSASPKFRGSACPKKTPSYALGNPGVSAINRIARQVVENVTVVPRGQHRPLFIAWDRLREGSPLEGDGIHCVRDYALLSNWHGKKHFGASCVTRAMLLLNIIANH